jgi:UrcA family protein
MKSNVKTVNRSILGYAAAMALACVLVTSNAYAGDDVHSQTVKFADLNLSTPAGVEALYRRIHAAAQRVCGYEATSAYGRDIWQNCVRPTVDATVAKVNNPQLTALHTGRNPSPATAMINR